MTTVRDLCTAALREIGVLAAGETMSADDATVALETLQRYMDSEGLDPLTIPTVTRTTFDVVPNVGTYQTTGGIDAYNVSVSDGFDSSWSGAPPGWTASGTGGGASVVNEDTDYQAGGHAVGLINGLSTQPTLYKDFVLLSGREATIVIWGHSDQASMSHVTVQTLETSHYLQADGTWDTVTDDIFDLANGSAYVQNSLTFDLEDEDVVGAATCTLRVSLYNSAAVGEGFFDTFSITTSDIGGIGIDRPASIDTVNLIDISLDPDQETPLTMLTEDGWASVTQKDMTSPQPTHWYYSPTYPYGTLQLWPIPTNSDLECAVYAKLPLSTLETLDTVVVLPAGYERFLVKNVALDLCPAFEKQPSPLLLQQASESKGRVKRRNRRIADLSFDGGALVGRSGVYNIRTDQ